MCDFKRQVLLAIIDKGLLGVTAVGITYFLNRRIEEFRSKRALEGEFLRERTRRLDELFTLMLDVEADGERFVDLAMDYIESRKGKPGNYFLTPRPKPEVDSARQAYVHRSQLLRRKSAHCLPWIGEHLVTLCAEYEKVVDRAVAEQTVAGTHDTEKIEELQRRTKELQSAIVDAIREGAPAGSGGSHPPRQT